MQKFSELVTSGKTSLWAWVIDPKYYHVNNTSLKLEKLESGLNAVDSQINQVYGDINEISCSEPDPDKAVCQLIQDTIAGMVVCYPSSTFAGFCRSIGKVDSVFSAVQIPVICRSYSGSTTPIKEITIVFYEIKNGAWDQELFRKTFGIEPVNPKETFDGILNLGRNLDLTQYDEVGIGYYTDSYSSPYRSSKLTSTEGLTAPARYTSLGWNSWSLISGSPKFEGMYFRLYKGLDRIVKVPSTVVDSIKDKVIGELGAADRTIDVSLPDKIYAVVGDKLQIFYRGCVKTVNPYNYDILVTCAKGKQFPRYFEYTPTTDDIGTTSFSITVKDDNGNILGTKSCELVTVANNPTVASSKTVLCFGDSLTASGLWCKTADERLPVNILFKGGKTVDSTGYFGVGGWTWDSYTTHGRPAVRFNVSGVASLSLNAVYTNNGVNYTVMEINVTDGTGNILCGTSNASVKPTGSTLTKSSGEGDAGVTFSAWSDDTQNPLWKDGAMTFVPYVDKYCGGTVDFVYTLLSWNGQSPHKTDFSAVIAQITNFARTLHSEYPGAKLKIMGVQVPSVTGGMGANYGATGTSYADTYGMVVTALNQNKAYQDFCNQDEFKAYCEFVNVSSQFDSEYNMPYAVRPVNSRWSEATERIGINGVHPSEAGYQQIGDIVYRNLMAQFS